MMNSENKLSLFRGTFFFKLLIKNILLEEKTHLPISDLLSFWLSITIRCIRKIQCAGGAVKK